MTMSQSMKEASGEPQDTRHTPRVICSIGKNTNDLKTGSDGSFKYLFIIVDLLKIPYDRKPR